MKWYHFLHPYIRQILYHRVVSRILLSINCFLKLLFSNKVDYAVLSLQALCHSWFVPRDVINRELEAVHSEYMSSLWRWECPASMRDDMRWFTIQYMYGNLRHSRRYGCYSILHQRSFSEQIYETATDALKDIREKKLPGFVIHVGPQKRPPRLANVECRRIKEFSRDGKVVDEYWPELKVISLY